MGTDGGYIGREIEDAPNARDDRRKRREVGEADRRQQRIAMRFARDLDPPALAVEADAAKIAAVHDCLDAGNRARREEREHRIPIVRRRVRKSANEAVIAIASVTVESHRIITVTQSRASRALDKN